MKIKSAILATVCALSLVSGVPAWAQPEAQAKQHKLSGRVRRRNARRTARPLKIPQTVDPFTERQIITGEIIDLGPDRFTVRDERGLDTVVLLFRDTVYRIEGPSGRVRHGNPGTLIHALKVTVEGLLNSSYRMKALIIRTTEADLRNARGIQWFLPSNPGLELNERIRKHL